MTAGAILTINAGSSGVKFALFSSGLTAMLRGEVAQTPDGPRLTARDASGAALAGSPVDAAPIDLIMAAATEHLGPSALAAVGHRVVHGGADHIAPERMTPALLAALEALTPLDPLHMPRSLAPMRAVAARAPALAQVACFDTGFHHTMPAVATRLGLPRALAAAGLRRYGFHGLSYEWIAGRLAAAHPDLSRVVVAHLGSGATLCALQGGVSVETTAGFSALDGLVMATRCGALDPGAVLRLFREGRTLAEVEAMLYHDSGLLGVSGISGDVRVLLASGEPAAAEALELFIYRIALGVAQMASAMGGIDALVFTAGIGARSPAIRAAVCDRLAWLGARLSSSANAANAPRINTSGSDIALLAMETDEEAMIARHTAALLGAAP